MSASKFRNAIKVLSGLGIVLVGLVGVGIGVLAMIDPAGAKQADGGGPFVSPALRLWSIAIVLFFALVVALGFWIISLADGRSNNGSEK